jgi:multimeric flavodoxin WrbA
MKVLMINGSPHAKDNTYIALHEIEEEFTSPDSLITQVD